MGLELERFGIEGFLQLKAEPVSIGPAHDRVDRADDGQNDDQLLADAQPVATAARHAVPGQVADDTGHAPSTPVDQLTGHDHRQAGIALAIGFGVGRRDIGRNVLVVIHRFPALVPQRQSLARYMLNNPRPTGRGNYPKCNYSEKRNDD